MEALYFSRAANILHNYLSSVHELYIYIMQRKTNYPHIKCSEEKATCSCCCFNYLEWPMSLKCTVTSPIKYLMWISWIYLPDGTCEIADHASHKLGLPKDSWLLSAWGMGERASGDGLPLPWHFGIQSISPVSKNWHHPPVWVQGQLTATQHKC